MMLLLLLGLRAEFPLRCTTISKFFNCLVHFPILSMKKSVMY